MFPGNLKVKEWKISEGGTYLRGHLLIQGFIKKIM